jgi:hypothetical protein
MVSISGYNHSRAGRKVYIQNASVFCMYAFKLAIQRLAGEPLNGKSFCAACVLVLETLVLPAHGTNFKLCQRYNVTVPFVSPSNIGLFLCIVRQN